MASSSENTVYTAVRPIQILTKVFGFCAQKNSLTKGGKINIIGIMHVIFILLLKVYLIFYNLNPSKFSKATNSLILNSGLWIQTEASLIISIVYILIGLRNNCHMWKLLQNFHEIDQEFSKSFFMKHHYAQAKHWILFVVAIGVMKQLILISITAVYIWHLQLECYHKLSILIAIFVSNNCIYAIANQHLCTQLYLSYRFQNINDILSQLIFDEPLSNTLIFEDLLAADNGSLVNSMSIERSQIVENVFKRPGKSGIAFLDNVDSNTIRLNYPFNKEFPRTMTIATNVETVTHKKANLTPSAHKTCITKLTFTRSSTVADVLIKLNKIMELHDRLCDCVDQCNYLFALQVLLIAMTICVYIVFGLFAKYRVWMDYQYEAANVAQMNIYWIVVYTFFILLTTHVSSRLMQTIKETAIIIHRVACRNEKPVLLKKLSEISQVLHSRKTTVGCGLIVYDWSTVSTLFASICMYLIILIQFYISAKSHKMQQQIHSNNTNFE